MNNALAKQDSGSIMEQVILKGDIGKLTPEERVMFYNKTCESLGLNPLTRPFDYIVLNGKMQLYARKDATEQLRKLHDISLKITSREVTEDCYVVTAQATNASGRQDESIGVVPIANLKGNDRANAMMKCETKAKRRVTLSISGLGFLDETEIETISQDDVGPKSLFKNASLRNAYCKKVIESFDGCQDITEIDTVMGNEAKKTAELINNGNEHDVLAVEAIDNHYAMAKKRLEDTTIEPSLEDWIEDIANVPTIEGLQHKFSEAQKLFKNRPDDFALIIDAKDIRKVQLKNPHRHS